MSVKEEKFIELANKRVNRAIKDIQLIANLSNTGNYSYTDDQASKIIKALQKEVDKVKVCFKDGSQNSSKKFSL